MSKLIEHPTKAKGVVHKMIADTAKGCCEAQWETLALQNKFYKAWPDKAKFVRHKWPDFIPIARALLTGMLGNPDYSDEKKAIIHEALMKDGAVNPKTMAKPASKIYFPITKT